MSANEATLVGDVQTPEKTVSVRDPANYYRTSEYKSIYSNVCQITVSQWDFQFLFCRGGRFLGETKIEEVATVYLTPAQAKALLGVLASQMHKFEQQHGVIKEVDVKVEWTPENSPKRARGKRQK